MVVKIFCDYHHGGLARSMFYLFGDRLGHHIRYADPSFALSRESWKKYGGTVSQEEFMDTDWDVFLFTRPETQQMIWNLGHRCNEKVIAIGQAGNENTVYDWGRVKHLITSDEDTWRLVPIGVETILTGQELGRHFGKKFTPVTEEGFHTVNCFINNLRGQSQAYRWSANNWGPGCPHCESRIAPKEHMNLFDLWKETSEPMNGYAFKVWGHTNEGLPGGKNLKDKDMPKHYEAGALTWHVKGFDGWGHSMLQSIACGRPVIVEKRFYRYRTAGSFLIPGVTCFYVDYNPTSCQAAIGHHTQDLDQVNHYAKRCWEAAKGLFDWKHEAWRVKRWMKERL